MINKILEFFQAKVWLLLIIAGIAALTFYSRMKVLEARNQNLKGQLSESLAVNESNLKTIKQLEQQREIDQEATIQLAKKLNELATADKNTRRSISNLERTNATVQSYLSTPVPPELSRLLTEAGDYEGRGNEGSASGKSNAAVRTSTTGRR